MEPQERFILSCVLTSWRELLRSRYGLSDMSYRAACERHYRWAWHD